MADFVFFLFSIFLTSHLSKQTSAQCSGLSFSRYSDSKLFCGVLKTFAASSIECQTNCGAMLDCFSINTYRSDNGTEICDLNKRSKESAGDGCFIYEIGSDHYELTEITSCSSGPCKKDENRTRAALPKGWYQLGRYRYRIFRKPSTWDSANQTCSNVGGSLASIDNELELKFVAEVFTKPAYDKTIKSMSPKYYWKLDGTDRDVNLFGNSFYKTKDGISTTYLELPGTSGSYAKTPAIDVLHTSFTISVWIRLDSIGGAGSIMPIYGYWQNPYIFNLMISKKDNGDNAIVVDMRRKSNMMSSLIYTSGGNVHLLIWTHIILTWNRSTGKAYLYKNGKQVAVTQASSPEDLPTATRPTFDIGLKRDSNTVFHGMINRLAVFDRVLGGEEINHIKNLRAVWLGKKHGFTNFVNASQQSPDSSCVSLKTIGRYDKMDKVDCTTKMQFICKR